MIDLSRPKIVTSEKYMHVAMRKNLPQIETLTEFFSTDQFPSPTVH